MNILIFILPFLSFLNAQISVPGKYRDLVLKSLQKSITMGADEVLAIYNLPKQDNARLLAEVEASERIDSENRLVRKNIVNGTEEIIYSRKPPKTSPFVFGKAIPLVIGMNETDQSHWIVNEENQTRMWRFKVYSKDAHSISIYFADFYLKPSAELYIIGQEVSAQIYVYNSFILLIDRLLGYFGGIHFSE